MTTPEPLIAKHNPQAGRFELEKDGHLAVLDYQLAEGKIIFTHTGVPAAVEGQGIGSSLARAGLEYARAHGLKVVPLCSFVAAYIRRHPEYQDLVQQK
jgi:predicted GNAT family acetyltransferase